MKAVKFGIILSLIAITIILFSCSGNFIAPGLGTEWTLSVGVEVVMEDVEYQQNYSNPSIKRINKTNDGDLAVLVSAKEGMRYCYGRILLSEYGERINNTEVTEYITRGVSISTERRELFFVFYKYRDDQNPFGHPVRVMKWQPDLRIAWETTILPETQAAYESLGLSPASDGGLYVHATYYPEEFGNESLISGVIIKFSSTGTKEWFYDSIFECDRLTIYRVFENPDGSLLVIGSRKDENWEIYYGYMVLDSNLQLVQTHWYSSPYPFAHFKDNRSYRRLNGGFAVCVNNSGEYSWMVLGDNYEIENEMLLGLTYVKYKRQHKDGSFTIAGADNSGTVHIIKLADNGTIISDETSWDGQPVVVDLDKAFYLSPIGSDGFVVAVDTTITRFK